MLLGRRNSSRGEERLADERFAGLVSVGTQLVREVEDCGPQFRLLAVKLRLDPSDATLPTVTPPVHEPLQPDSYPVEESAHENERDQQQCQVLHSSPPRHGLGGTHRVRVDDVLVAGLTQRGDLNQVRLERRQGADVL